MNEIASLTNICRNFPPNPLQSIQRENHLEIIDKAFSNGIQVVFVDGDQGIGKTTVLSQYMQRHEGTTIGLFITPISRLAYSKDYINTVIVEQLTWLFGSTRYQRETATCEEVHKLMISLQKHARTNPFTFVIDGLDEIDSSERDDVTDYIFQEVLPLGLREFRYVISGTTASIKLPGIDKIKNQVHQVFPFETYQIRNYFEKFNLSETDIKDLKDFSNGIPLRLEVALRWLEDGNSIDGLYDFNGGKFSDLFELDWKRVELDSREKRLALAIITFANRPIFIGKVAELSGMKNEEVQEFFTQSKLIEMVEGNEPIRFRNEAQRAFVKRKLETNRIETETMLIEDLIARSSDRDSILYLVDDLAQAGRNESVLIHLNNNHFEKVLIKEQSLSVLKRHATTGRKAAQKLQKNAAILQYGLSQSLILQLDGAFTNSSEIRALLKLSRCEEAISIACAADTKEDRFALLAAIGSHLVAEKENFPTELRNHITQVAESIDFSTLGGRASAIAEDLVAFDPDLAFQVLGSSSNDGQKTSNDLRFAQFHFAISNSQIGIPARESAQKRARDQITNTKLQDFTDAAAALLSKYDAAQIISKADKLPGQHRLNFLKTWLVQNASADGAADVAEHALDVMLNRLEHTPRLSDFREISAVLPFMKDQERARSILHNVESQRALIPNHGTNEEYVRLQMTLLQAEAALDIERAKERAIDLYAEVDDISDVGTRTACLAWMLHYMHDIENLGVIDKEIGILESVASQLIAAFDSLLLSTADHFSIAKRPIDALAKYYPEKAFNLVGRLNTQERRNKGYGQLINAQLRSKAYRLDCTFLFKSLKEISTATLKDHAIVEILEVVKKDENFDINAPKAMAILNLWSEAKSPEVKYLSLVATYLTLKKKDLHKANSLNLESNLQKIWDAMPGGWYKVQCGYKAVHQAAIRESNLAEQWLAVVRDESDKTIALSEDLTKTISAMMLLTIRSAGGLVKMGKMNSSFWGRLCSLINSLPRGPEQINLWTDLSVRCALKGDIQKCQEIVKKYILPTIDNVENNHCTLKSFLIYEAAPALYLNHANSCEEYLSSMPEQEAGEARSRICDMLLSQLSPFEPSPDQHPIEYVLEYDRVLDVCAILEKISNDSAIFSVVSIVCDSLASKKNRTTMSRSQKSAVIERLTNIVSTQLPDKKNIQHDGFKIACRAKILKAKTQLQKVDVIDWEKLRAEADTIPNIADRTIVICIVAVQASTQNMGNTKKWLGEARLLANSISSHLDRVDRFKWMAEMVGKIDPAFCQNVVKEAFELVNTFDENNYSAEKHRELLDLAHQHDPKLADNLIAIVDTDPARRAAKGELNSHIKVLKARKKIFDKESSQFSTLDDEELHEVASKNLSSLVYERYATCHMNEMLPLILRASVLPLSEAMAMWSLFIENMNRRFENTQQDILMMPDVFESILNAAELAITLVGKAKRIGKYSEASTTIFRDGDRDAAYDAIREWLTNDTSLEILISDPYFGPDDLDLLKIIQELRPSSRVRLLGSSEHVLKYQTEGKELEDIFKDKWSEISDQDPPRTDITLAALKSTKKHPIHDRWFVSGNTGLRVGTSVNSIGIGRTSEISQLTGEEVCERTREIVGHLNRDMRDKVSYKVVDL